MGEAMGLRKGTITLLETDAAPLTTNNPHATTVKRSHIVSFCVAWMLLNGGPMIPWPRKEDAERLRSFRNFHGMTNNEMAALFDVSIREMEYAVSPTAERGLTRMHMMALCWMRIFGSRDPFAFPLHREHDVDAAATCPMRLDPAPVIELRANPA